MAEHAYGLYIPEEQTFLDSHAMLFSRPPLPLALAAPIRIPVGFVLLDQMQSVTKIKKNELLDVSLARSLCVLEGKTQQCN
jgi:hypothetical protein